MPKRFEFLLLSPAISAADSRSSRFQHRVDQNTKALLPIASINSNSDFPWLINSFSPGRKRQSEVDPTAVTDHLLTPRALIVLMLAISTLGASDTFNAFGHKWTVPNVSDWRVEQVHNVTVLHLLAPRGPLPGPRRPIQFALADTPEFEHVTMDLDAKPLESSLILVFAYRDAAHFDYAHLSTDRASYEPHHNGIFHVYGGERVRISSEEGPPAFSATKRWYHVRLIYDGQAGTVQVMVNGQPVPALHAIDLSLRAGKVGVGSFDETGDFKSIKIQ